MTKVNTVNKAGRFILLALIGIALLYALGTAPSYAAGHIPISAVSP